MKLTDNIASLIGKSFCDGYSIDQGKEYDIEYIEARKLFTLNRIDLIIKYKYVESYVKSIDTTFFRDLYCDHIRAFSYGTFTEYGQENTKNTIEKYIQAFNILIDSIASTGFDENQSIIPVGKDDAIMDGAHRVAIAAYYNLTVPIVRFPQLEAHNDLHFFEQRLMKPEYLDYLAFEYSHFNKDTHAVCLWPLAFERKDLIAKAEDLLSECSVIIYKKTIDIDKTLLRNLMIQVYSEFDWLGGIKDHFPGATNYAEEVYSSNKQMNLYLVKCDDLDKIILYKSKIREMFGFGNASIHITDTIDETINIAQMLLNENSRHCLLYAEPDKYIRLNILIEKYKEYLNSHSYCSENFIIDSGGVLALYGLRETDDLDFITLGAVADTGTEDISQHKENDIYYDISVPDLIYNPENYLYYNGLKFVSITNLLSMKKKRYEERHDEKDKEDIQLLISIENPPSIKKKVKEAMLQMKRTTRKYKFRILKFVSSSVICKPIRYVYHIIKHSPYHG